MFANPPMATESPSPVSPQPPGSGAALRPRLCLALLLVTVSLAGGAVALSPNAVPAAEAAASARQTGTYGVWGDRSTPDVRVAKRRGRTTLGLRLKVDKPGRILGVQFYASPATRGPQEVHLWNRRGRSLASATLPAERGEGWRTASFASPVKVTPGRTYVAGYMTPHGRFSLRRHALSPRDPRTHHALSGLRGLRANGARFPEPSRGKADFLVDVVYDAAEQRTGHWPGAKSTGVPTEVTLTEYHGPMTITRNGTVIDGKQIRGDLRVKARDVLIKNSSVFGDIRIDSEDSGYSMTIKRSEIDAGRAAGQDAFDGTGIGARDFKAIRVEVRGGKRSVNCYLNCAVKHSWLHAQSFDETGQHESAIRMGSNSRIVHNKLVCDPRNGSDNAGCSASLTGYPDFAPVRNNLIKNNYFPVSSGGTCAYGGSTRGKPYSGQTRRIRFIDNVFERGRTGYCGYWASIMDFERGAPGNVWSGNRYTGGRIVRP